MGRGGVFGEFSPVLQKAVADPISVTQNKECPAREALKTPAARRTDRQGEALGGGRVKTRASKVRRQWEVLVSGREGEHGSGVSGVVDFVQAAAPTDIFTLSLFFFPVNFVRCFLLIPLLSINSPKRPISIIQSHR